MKPIRLEIHIHNGRRVVLYPEGGLELHVWVEGPGWVLDNDAEVPDYLLADLCMQAKRLAADQAEKLS